MSPTGNEKTDLMRQHEAIRAQMKFIISSLSSLATTSIPLKERIWGYRNGLYDFREGVRRHIELDEHLFNKLFPPSSVTANLKEHEAITLQMDNAVKIAEKAVAGELGQEELEQSVLNIREAFNSVKELIEAHTAREDKLLKSI